MVGRGDTPARNVIGLLDWYRLSKEVLLVLERPVPCKDLCDFLEDEEDWLVEDEAKVIMRQLVEATLDIHSRGVVHRDLKPKNVLVETGSGHPRVHVIDFGCGSVLREKPYTSFSGTRAYTAPEWYQKHEFYAEPSTVWQLGVVLHQMVTGERPFNGEEEIVHKKLDLWRFVSRDCQDLLRRCLDKRPLARPTMAEILQHPWLQCCSTDVMLRLWVWPCPC
ncbi:hypothetical protein MATL_G00156140 [Megalops atlanticus]|uniref:Serine/threonine-protein kinase 1 n=1 Tax=Megalops atlanticus TaxID=7932 RepID=A0A9D3PSH1_MEGAT|nr:hypothetical protein MATL_G00156140 [Megalops atlanticus]